MKLSSRSIPALRSLTSYAKKPVDSCLNMNPHHSMRRDSSFKLRDLSDSEHRTSATRAVAVEKENTESGFGGNSGGISSGFGGSNGSNPSPNYDSTEVYYQRMIVENPDDPLIAANYARFLIEVRGDKRKAEEYCERAMLNESDDGNLVSLYANLIWEKDKDASRAEHYFDRALMAAPDDCFVLASYARFLWDVDCMEAGSG